MEEIDRSIVSAEKLATEIFDVVNTGQWRACDILYGLALAFGFYLDRLEDPEEPKEVTHVRLVVRNFLSEMIS